MSSAKKKFEILKLRIFFYFEFFFLVLVPEPYLISACVTTLSALRTVALRHIYLIHEYSKCTVCTIIQSTVKIYYLGVFFILTQPMPTRMLTGMK